MKTTIEVDSILLEEAMRIVGSSTADGTVEEALRCLVRESRRRAIEDLAGIGWEGDLERNREGRTGR